MRDHESGHELQVRFLRPLLETMKAEVGEGRVVQNAHENKLAEHGMPPTEDLAEKLRLHLWRAEVRRADLHDDRPGTKKVTFYDLRATGITWEALAKTEFLAIMQRAGHRESKTTLGYIREAEAVGIDAGGSRPQGDSKTGPAYLEIHGSQIWLDSTQGRTRKAR